MTATLAIPQPTSLAQVDDTCASVEAWAEQCDDIPALRDTANKLAAIDEYLARTSTDGRARVAATQRRLESRIGNLIGPAENHGPATLNHDERLSPHQRNEFRQMAANPDVVDEVIEQSDDANPPSRRKVMAAIKTARRQEDEAILDVLHEEYGDDLTDEQIEQAVDDNLDSKITPTWIPAKPDLGGVSHPARYSTELLPLFADLLRSYSHPGARVLDPFAGTGRIHELHPEFDTVGIELEKEWADLHERTQQGNALDLPFDPDTFDAIVTSPTYGNRLADSHNASDPERRRSYTHDLGHELHGDNSGALHWRHPTWGRGAFGSFDYRNFHEKAWDEAVLVLRPGGLFILNCCDHIRDGLVQPVTAWHCHLLGRLGLEYVDSGSVDTRKLRQGANGNLREQEQVHVFRKPL